MKYAMQWLGEIQSGLTYFKTKYGNNEKDADCIIGETNPKLPGIKFLNGKTRNVIGDNWLIGWQDEEVAKEYFPKGFTS